MSERFPKSKSEWYFKSSIFILKCFIRGRGKTIFIYCTYAKHMYTHINAHTHPVHLPIPKAETPSNKTSKYVAI